MSSEIIIYQTEDGKTKIETRLENETVWLTQAQIALLFAKGRSTITEHLGNIFKEGELEKELVSRKFRHTTPHGAIAGKTQESETTFYNLDVIISVGYRTKAHKEYDRFKEKTNDQLSMVEKDFIKQIEQTQQQLKNKQ